MINSHLDLVCNFVTTLPMKVDTLYSSLKNARPFIHYIITFICANRTVLESHCIKVIMTSMWQAGCNPGEMVNGSLRMFANVHDVKTTHPIYFNYFSHESSWSQNVVNLTFAANSVKYIRCVVLTSWTFANIRELPLTISPGNYPITTKGWNLKEFEQSQNRHI